MSDGDLIDLIQPTSEELRREVDRMVNLGYFPVGDVRHFPFPGPNQVGPTMLSQRMLRDVDHD